MLVLPVSKVLSLNLSSIGIAMLKPIKKKRVSDMAIEQINQLISTGHLKPGDTLPSERTLMEKFKISRVPVREALRVLEMMGVVEVKPGKGIYVTDPENSLFSPLRQWLSIQKETLFDHFEVRLLIEPRAAAFCASRASKKHSYRKLRARSHLLTLTISKSICPRVTFRIAEGHP